MGYSFEPVPEDLALRQFRAAMAAHGVIPLAGIDALQIVRDGKIHQFDVEGGKRGNKAGRYLIHNDSGPIAGWFQDWRQMSEPIPWCFDYKVLRDDPNYSAAYEQSQTPAFRAAAKRLQAERERQRAAEQAKEIAKAKAEYEKAPVAQEGHPYLKRKNIKLCGHVYKGSELKIKEIGGKLIVPFVNKSGEFRTYLQLLPQKNQDGKDKFLRVDCPSKGAFFVFGGDITEGPILFAEGWATAATVYEATGMMTVCARSSGNLLFVCQSLRRVYPGRKFFIAADDDVKTEQKIGRNPGMEDASKCVKAKAADDMIWPPFDRAPDKDGLDPSDWNDYAAIYGIEATEKALREAIESSGKQKGNTDSKMISPKRKARPHQIKGRPYLPNAYLIEAAMKAKNGPKFTALWNGDTSGYASQSDADMALIKQLLFWTNGDIERTSVLFGESALGQHSKWTERADYRKRTLDKASSSYSPNREVVV